MKKIHGLAVVGLVLFASTVGCISAARAMCFCFPCDDCDLRSRGQLNIVVMDREHGRVGVIPNIRITGTADDFALVIPTPSFPTLEPVAVEIWDQVLDMTRPLRNQRGANDGLGCGDNVGFAQSDSPADGEDVRVLVEQQVGAFQVTVVMPEDGDPEKLARWLVAQGYVVTPEDAAALAPYAQRGWVFSAMKLLPGTPIPARWDANVDPVFLTYDATELEIPLPLFKINRAASLPVEFFVVDDHRADITGFTTSYANQISSREYEGARNSYPDLAPYLSPGRFLTRLNRVFETDESLATAVLLGRAAQDQEFRRIQSGTVWSGFPAGLLGLAGLLTVGRIAQRRRLKPR